MEEFGGTINENDEAFKTDRRMQDLMARETHFGATVLPKWSFTVNIGSFISYVRYSQSVGNRGLPYDGLKRK